MNKSLLAVSVVLTMLALMLTGCGSGNKQKLEGQVSVSGAFALYPLAVQWSNDFQVRYPKVKIDVSAGGAGKGMTDVLNGMVDYAMLSRELHKEEVDAGAVAFVVGRDAVIPVINSENPYIEELLKKDGMEVLDPVITGKHTYVAPFVNAEECQYLVIEDHFPNGRPALEKGGLIFTSRETVDMVERMKVCTCLNPLHTALAVFGCLLGYERISEEMKNPSLRKLVEQIGYTEGLPVVTDPGILDPKEFLDTVLNVRIPNPFMPDTPRELPRILPRSWRSVLVRPSRPMPRILP